MTSSHSRRRTRTALTATALTGLLAFSSVGIADAQEPTPIDPTQGRGTLGQITGPLICDPPDSPFRMTSECEVDHDNNVETPTINPYTRAAESPGLLGTAGLGALAPLGLNELLQWVDHERSWSTHWTPRTTSVHRPFHRAEFPDHFPEQPRRASRPMIGPTTIDPIMSQLQCACSERTP